MPGGLCACGGGCTPPENAHNECGHCGDECQCTHHSGKDPHSAGLSDVAGEKFRQNAIKALKLPVEATLQNIFNAELSAIHTAIGARWPFAILCTINLKMLVNLFLCALWALPTAERCLHTDELDAAIAKQVDLMEGAYNTSRAA